MQNSIIRLEENRAIKPQFCCNAVPIAQALSSFVLTSRHSLFCRLPHVSQFDPNFITPSPLMEGLDCVCACVLVCVLQCDPTADPMSLDRLEDGGHAGDKIDV